jgi:AcrR family transcriptional regulator
MAGEMRDRMVQEAMALLAKRGLQATSFSEVLAAACAPRGSLYHHFPQGKDQLVAAAVDRAGGVLTQALDTVAGAPAEAVVARFFAIWRAVLTRSNFEAGCAVLAVVVATDSPELQSHGQAVFRSWKDRLAGLLQQGGLEATQARQFAIVLIAAAEGAVVLCRAEQTLEPLEAVAGQMEEQARLLRAPQRKKG